MFGSLDSNKFRDLLRAFPRVFGDFKLRRSNSVWTAVVNCRSVISGFFNHENIRKCPRSNLRNSCLVHRRSYCLATIETPAMVAMAPPLDK